MERGVGPFSHQYSRPVVRLIIDHPQDLRDGVDMVHATCNVHHLASHHPHLLQSSDVYLIWLNYKATKINRLFLYRAIISQLVQLGLLKTKQTKLNSITKITSGVV